MKNVKKLLAMALTAIMAVSAMSISAMAQETIVEGKIDYSVYDSDMVYIQEDADMIAEYNAQRKMARAITDYPAWNMSKVFSKTGGELVGLTIPYYFVPVNDYLYFNAEVLDGERASKPRLTVTLIKPNGDPYYVGSYYITSQGDGTYKWDNYKRALSAGSKYVFSVQGTTNWDYVSIDIYKSKM